ncbi:MAG: class 1 isoprenoid biosynthesis enzyme [Candidatus Methanofastidiosia archaeon]|jgi:hypothetical protein
MNVTTTRIYWEPNEIETLSGETLQGVLNNFRCNCSLTKAQWNISKRQKKIFKKIRNEIIFDLKNHCDFNEIKVKKPIAKEVLQEVYSYIETAEKKFHCPHTIKRKEHLYPLDVILLFNESKISEKELKIMSSAATFFYMLSHFTDDYLDDPMKVHSKFITDDTELDVQKIFKIFWMGFKEFTKDNFSKRSAIMLQDAFQSKYFDMIITFGDMIEQFDNLKIEDRFSFSVHWKAHKLSGLMYSFLSDVILHTTNICTSLDAYNNLNKVTQNLGELCQLTDDMRDFEKDIQNNQINIFHSLLDLYAENEEKLMKNTNDIFDEKIYEVQKNIKFMDIQLDREKLISVASYPFFKEKL